MTPPHIKKSREQEKRTAKAHNGRTQPGSGSGWVHRNDVLAERFLVENKRTDKKQITIKGVDLRQLRINAALIDRIGLLEFELEGHDYVVLHKRDFREYIDEE